MINKRREKSEKFTNSSNSRMIVNEWKRVSVASRACHIANSTLRFQTKFVTVIALFGLAALIFTRYAFRKSGNLLKTSPKEYIFCHSPDYNGTYPLTSPKIVSDDGIEFEIGLVADLDVNSKCNRETTEGKTVRSKCWLSYLLKGKLTWYSKNDATTVRWETRPIVLRSSYSLAGRGMELSEAIIFDGRLLTFDDRTGIVYEIRDSNSVIPWIMLTDGDGNVNKGFKSEWATVKDDTLYVGSMGKEWTSSKGVYMNHNPMFVKIIHRSGYVKHVDWRTNYKKLRQTIGIHFPGYMIHESAVWSSVHRKWFFLPRRSSAAAYDEVTDEYQGTNLLLIADENFNEIEVKYIGQVWPTRGYSSFKFIPMTNDRIIAAIKSEEVNGTSSTYMTVFTIDGLILLADEKISDLKYEGIEFI